ncbi:sensor histidine kinase [Bordetella sp. H567]|uniref:sensor histidine kinase n=1 Tax=Bordetella sp. H567 TaxID=1697043 RepID=UPI00082D033C|nr:HAMP domain-containing sensor histidine kinase [Bordetella sp. H567]
MNPDLWYPIATSALLHSFRASVAGLAAAILVILLLAAARRRTGFPGLAALLLLMSQAARAALLTGALAPWVPAAAQAGVSAGLLGLGASAVLWMAGGALRRRRAAAWAAFFRLAAWLAAIVSCAIAVAGDRLALHAGVDAASLVPLLAVVATISGGIAFLVLLTEAATPARRLALGNVAPSQSRRAAARARAQLAPAALASGQREIEARLSMLNEVLERQRQMNALLSHEMRSPVATISAAVQSLQMVLEGSDEQVDSRLQRIGRAVARINELMDQLLVQESTYDEALAPRHEVVDLARLAADVVASIQHDVAHRLQLEAPEPSPAWCDGPLTGVVLRNVIHNAVKYSPADQPIVIQVGTLTAPGERTAWIAVADRGPGIAKEDQARIFDPHFRQAAHRETKGLGLGLFLVRKICERQGGTLTVESEPGEGARFTIALPVSKVR